MVSKSKVDMTVAKWKDKRSVLMISKAHIPKMRDILTIYNAHIPKMATVTNRRGNEKQKPNMVKDYNNSMSGINRSDQMLSYHFDLTKNLRCIRKQGYISLKCFLQMPSISTKSSPLTEISLTLSTSKKTLSNVLFAKERRKISWNLLLTFITLHQSQKQRKKNPTRRCKQRWKNKSRKESRYVCGYCENHPALWIHPCFRLYHQGIGVTKHQEEVTFEVAGEA